ncbi:N-acetyltransferase [Mycena rebaudengoi]|nr:N-acetyltransferase [Mycena rebaudengoi]
MSVLRPFTASDMFKFNNINLDLWTQTYAVGFYLNYLSRWPDLCCVQAAPSGRLMGYILGKAEGANVEWHGHVTVLTVAPEYRRLGLASKLVALLELVSNDPYRGYFVDLYMYEGMGYSVYRRVREYYDHLGGPRGRDEEDAFDMRKPLSRDTGRRSVRPNGREMLVSRWEVS